MNTLYLNCGDEEFTVRATYVPQVNSIITALYTTKEENTRRKFIVTNIEYPMNLHDYITTECNTVHVTLEETLMLD